MSKYEIIISDTAAEQLENCVLFIAKDDSEAAEKLKIKLMDGIRSLCDWPFRYPFFNENYIPANKYHKMLIANWYLVLYQIKGSTVFVDYVLDCRRDYKWLI